MIMAMADQLLSVVMCSRKPTNGCSKDKTKYINWLTIMSSISLPDRDIGTDAEVETPQDGSMHQNLPDRLLEPVSENNYAVASLHSEGSDNEKEYLNYVHLMPKDLQNDYIDILIMCAEADEDDAENFKFFLETHQFSVDILVIGPVISHEAKSLYNRSMFYFVYVTKEYLQCSKSKLYADSFLAKSMSDKTKAGNVFPVLTSDKNECNLDKEIFFGNMRPIQYYKEDKDIGKIIKILKTKSLETAERKDGLKNLRLDYFHRNKQLMLKYQSVSNPGFLSMKLPNIPDLKLEDAGQKDHSKLENVGMKSDAASETFGQSFGPFEYQPKPKLGKYVSGDIQVYGIPSDNKEIESKLKP